MESFEMSPNRNWLAYTKWQGSNAWLVIVDAQGKIVNEVQKNTNFDDVGNPEEGTWTNYAWLDDQHLIIKVVNWSMDEMVLLNPFTNDRQTIFADYPHNNYIFNANKLFTIYDSTLVQAAYPGTLNGTDSLVLYDIPAQEVLFNAAMYLPFYRPKWSPDDHMLAATLWESADATQNDLYVIGESGNLQQVTHLSSNHTGRESVDALTVSWSPDSKQIAFLAIDDHHDHWFMVADLENQQVTDYCLPDAFRIPIWSPDGTHLALALFLDGDDRGQTVIVDLEQGTSTLVSENVFPVGWMVAPEK